MRQDETMWPFKRSKKPEDVPEQPNSRYEGQPMLLLLESFVLDVIGHLDQKRANSLLAMTPKLRQTFNSSSSDWKNIIREVLHMSSTIEIAILDLWIRNNEIAGDAGKSLEPLHYSQMFADEYLRDGSKIDVWPDDALELAKQRISAWQRGRPDA